MHELALSKTGFEHTEMFSDAAELAVCVCTDFLDGFHLLIPPGKKNIFCYRVEIECQYELMLFLSFNSNQKCRKTVLMMKMMMMMKCLVL